MAVLPDSDHQIDRRQIQSMHQFHEEGYIDDDDDNDVDVRVDFNCSRVKSAFPGCFIIKKSVLLYASPPDSNVQSYK